MLKTYNFASPVKHDIFQIFLEVDGELEPVQHVPPRPGDVWITIVDRQPLNHEYRYTVKREVHGKHPGVFVSSPPVLGVGDWLR